MAITSFPIATTDASSLLSSIADAVTSTATARNTALGARDATLAAAVWRATRPGSDPAAFVLEASGAPDAVLTPILDGTGVAVETLAGAGKVVTVDGATQIIGARTPTAIQPARIYRMRGMVQRLTDPSDPATTNVQMCIQKLDAAYSSLGTTVLRSKSLVIADGIWTFDETFAVTGTVDQNITVGIAATSVYARPFLRCNGTDHKTAILQLDIADVTEVLAAASGVGFIDSRPGTHPGSFSNVVSGDPSTILSKITSLSGVAVEIVDGMGKALTIENAAITVAPKQVAHILPGRVYKYTARVKRISDPVDPSVSSVILQIKPLTSSFGDNGVRTVSNLTAFVVDSGTTIVSSTFALSGYGGAAITLPEDTSYIRPVFVTVGTDHKTAVDLIEIVDITEALVLAADSPYPGVYEYGAVGDGVADEAAAIAAADAVAGGISFGPGTYKVSSNITIASPVFFAPGALLAPDDGITVTFQNTIESGWYQIFSGDGAIDIERSVIKSDWFTGPPNTGVDQSAAVQNMYNAVPEGGTVLWGPGRDTSPNKLYNFANVTIPRGCTNRGFGQISTGITASDRTKRIFGVLAHNTSFHDMLLEHNASGSQSEDTTTCHVHIATALNSTRFINVWFAGKPYSCIKTINGAGEFLALGCTFDGGFAANIWGNGLYLARIIGNYLGGTAKNPLLLGKTSGGVRCSRIVVSGNVAGAVPEAVVLARGVDGLTIAGNSFAGISSGGAHDSESYIDLDDCTSVAISGNSSAAGLDKDVKHAIVLGSLIFANDVLIGTNAWAPCPGGEVYHQMFGGSASGHNEPRKLAHTAEPEAGNYFVGDFVQNLEWASPADAYGWLCTKSGTLGTAPAVTVSGLAGARAITASSTVGVSAGMTIQIAGEPTTTIIRRVNPVNGELIVYPELDGDRTSASISFDAAVFSAVYFSPAPS